MTTTQSAFVLTPSAMQQVRQLRAAGNHAQTNLRVKVVGGGCSGFSYKMDFDGNVGPHDKVFEFEDVKVTIDPKSYLYLKGIAIDFEDGLESRGFKFINPNAQKTCGCGESFSV